MNEVDYKELYLSTLLEKEDLQVKVEILEKEVSVLNNQLDNLENLLGLFE